MNNQYRGGWRNARPPRRSATAPDKQFRNPYHFVPVDEPPMGSVPRDFGKDYPATLPDSATHDRWDPALHNGSLLVELETRSPLLIGARRHPPDSSRGGFGAVDRFELPLGADGAMVPAIPSTSLRGMISNIAEAASGSALRVLKEVDYEGFTSHSFFEAVRPNLVPLEAGGRTELSLAEVLFGFVEGSPKDKGLQRAARALASRVRFSHGVPVKLPVKLDEKVPLAVLGEPKPPCTAMYFEPVGGRLVAKHSLRPGIAKPNGRKWYLHQQSAMKADRDTHPKPWEYLLANDPSGKPKLTAYAEPVTKGEVFQFRIDFENLTDLELECLCFSVCPPIGSADSPFLHKLGMGKPIGLGSVKLTIAALLLSDRKHRYSTEGFRAGRYRWGNLAIDACPAEWPNLSPWKVVGDNPPSEALPTSQEPSRLALQFSEKLRGIAPDRWRALQLLGQIPADLLVHYPQPETVDGERMHADGFNWFKENERGRRRENARGRGLALDTITQNSQQIPSLPRRPVE